MTAVLSLIEFSKRVLAGEEAVLFSIKNEVVGHQLYCGLGPKQTADFNHGPFPLFSVNDYKGTSSYHWHFTEFYEVQMESLPVLEALAFELDDLASYASETLSSFSHKVARLQQLEQDGEFWVANLTQNLSGPLPKTVSLSALALQTFVAFLTLEKNHCGGVVITKEQIFCSLSPETFLVHSNDWVKAFPIKGTGTEEYLLSSEKEVAELRMITDLIRNDLGQICKTVHLERERYLTEEQGFFHARAEVQGQLPSSELSWQQYRQLLPAGSISGAPKHRVLQALDKLENFDRGFYTGTFGVKFNANRSIFNILIRTLFLDSKTHGWSFPVGAGITIESDPAEEWAETLQKASLLKILLSSKNN